MCLNCIAKLMSPSHLRQRDIGRNAGQRSCRMAVAVPFNLLRGRLASYPESAAGPMIPAIMAIRTRSDRLAACIFVMRLAR
jgi:hypothetical protein